MKKGSEMFLLYYSSSENVSISVKIIRKSHLKIVLVKCEKSV